VRRRHTQQMKTIRDVLEKAGRPLSPNEVLEIALFDRSGLGLATVYRALKDLVDEGWLTIVELPGSATHYELNGKAHHHHFSCRSCGGIYDLEGCAFDMNHPLPAGFTLEDHEVVLYGLCAGCGSTG
jgi:Fur family ferric uptake transcriptional regulator